MLSQTLKFGEALSAALDENIAVKWWINFQRQTRGASYNVLIVSEQITRTARRAEACTGEGIDVAEVQVTLFLHNQRIGMQVCSHHLQLDLSPGATESLLCHAVTQLFR